MERNLPLLRRVSRRHPRVAIALVALLLVVSVIAITRATFDTDVTRLIPLHAEKTALYIKIMEKTGGMEKAYIVFSSDRLLDHIAAIDAVGSEIRATGLVTSAEWKIGQEARTFLRDVYAKKAPLLLDDAEMREFLGRLTGPGMERELEISRQRLSLPGAPAGLIAADPLNLFSLFLGHAPFSQGSVDAQSGYYLTPDRKQAIMVLTPSGSPRDISFDGRFVGSVERVLERHRAPGLSISLTGSHAITLHEASVMKRELVMNIAMSFASVIAFFLVFFRSVRGLLFVLIPTVLSMAITTGSVVLFSDSLSEVSGGFSALIAGLGIDLGIVLYVRYLIELQSGAGTDESMDASIAMVHRGITTGVLTSAITFLPMLLSSFRGVRELSLLTGIALLICWALLFGLVPLIVRPSKGRVPRLSVVERITAFSFDRAPLVFMLVIVLSLPCIWLVTRIEVVGDISRLGTADNPARSALEQLKKVYLSEAAVFVTADAPDLDAALSKSLELKGSVSDVLDNVQAVGDFLPPLGRQQKNIAVLETVDAQRVEKDFLRAAARAGFRADAFRPFLANLDSMLRNREPLVLDELDPVKDMVGRLLVRDKDGWTVFVTGTPRESGLPAITAAAATGPGFVRAELLSILTRDTVLISLVGLLLVNIVLYLDFRSVYDTVLCQVPVFVSILWTLGVMGAFGISLNFMNAFVFVMLFGIGTDYAVHLLHRYLSDRDVSGTFSQTGKAIFISGLTTVAGVGSIGNTSYRGLASMGQVTAIGTFFCVVLALTLVPAMMRLRRPEPGRTGER